MPDYFPLAANTLLLTLETLAIALPLGTALAWLLVRSDVPGHRIGLWFIGLMIFIPLYLQASAWQAGFGQEGWYSYGKGGQSWLTGWNAALWVHTLAAIPWIVLITALGLQTVEPALEEQALLDGTPWQAFWRVTLPACWPAVGLAAAWAAMLTAGEMTVTSIFFVRTYAEEVFNQIALHEEQWNAVNALAPGILGTMALLGLAIYCCFRLARPDRPLNLRPSRLQSLGRWRWPLVIGLAAVLVVLAGVPLGNLLYKAGVVVAQVGAGRVRTWSGVKCLQTIVMAPVKCRRECFWSLTIGTLAATAATLAAVPLAWAARQSRWLGVAVTIVAIACVALPGSLLALAIIWLLNDPRVPWLNWLYDHSILGPWLALTFRALGPAVLVLWYAVRTIPREMLDSAATEGCGPLGQFWHIVLPQRRSALVVAWLIGLALALGDLTASALVVPPGVETLSIHIFNLVHYGVEDQVAGICLAQLIVFGLVAAVTAALAKRFRWDEA
jgi:iron(III) transport system permease protein